MGAGFPVACGALALLLLGLALAFRFEVKYQRYRPLIEAAAARYAVPSRLVGAVAWQETRFEPYRRGKAGELGLMQLMPGSAAEWAQAEGITNFTPVCLLDPGTNLMAGTWYLARAIRRWQHRPDPLPYALAEYNAGRVNARRWDQAANARSVGFDDAISYPGTRRYVAEILRRYRAFGRPWRLWFTRLPPPPG
jgi:soluble lytic murein transglycosylase